MNLRLRELRESQNISVATMIERLGVQDSVNAAAHGHSERVSYTNYQRGDSVGVAEQTGRYLQLIS